MYIYIVYIPWCSHRTPLIPGMSAHNAWTSQTLFDLALSEERAPHSIQWFKISFSLSQRQRIVTDERWTRDFWTNPSMLVFLLFPHLLLVNSLCMFGVNPRPYCIPLHAMTCCKLVVKPVFKTNPEIVGYILFSKIPPPKTWLLWLAKVAPRSLISAIVG